MLISDHFFLLYFFPAFILLYLVFSRRIALGNLIIIIFSLLFYSSFGLKNLPILIFPLVADFLIALWIYKTKNQKQRFWILSTAVFLNLLLLGYYKYANFLSDNMLIFFPNSEFLLSLQKDILLPVGISFITFQRISYLIDTYRKQILPEKNILKYATYASLFPHLLAGPIVRYSEIKKQLSKRIINSQTIYLASQLFVAGLFFKIFIADQIFLLEEHFSLALAQLNSAESLLLILCFSFRIYFDFMGYSLMALGLAKFAGFDFPINFNSPYQSQSITEFWRRWNITLGTWLKDYLYIPLGGNKKGESRTYINLLITMLLAGLWHGANWNFVIWGCIHGVFLAIERFFVIHGNYRLAKLANLPKVIKVTYCFLLVTLAWTTFKFTTPQEIFQLLGNIVSFEFGQPDTITRNRIISASPALIGAFIWSFFLKEKSIPLTRFSYKIGIFLSIVFILILGYSLIRRSIPFIYFQF